MPQARDKQRERNVLRCQKTQFCAPSGSLLTASASLFPVRNATFRLSFRHVTSVPSLSRHILGFQKKNGTQRKKTAASFSTPMISSVVFEMFRKSLPSIRFEAKMHQRLICVYSSVTVSGVPWSQGVPRIRLSLHPTVSCTPSQARQAASQSVSQPPTPSNDRSSQLRSAPVRFTYDTSSTESILEAIL